MLATRRRPTYAEMNRGVQAWHVERREIRRGLIAQAMEQHPWMSEEQASGYVNGRLNGSSTLPAYDLAREEWDDR